MADSGDYNSGGGNSDGSNSGGSNSGDSNSDGSADSSRLDELKLLWESDPSSKVYLQLAEAYREVGRHEDAIRVLETSLEHRPRDPRGRVALARCHLELAAPDRAIELLEEVARLDPAHLVANKLLLEAYLRQGDAESATDRLKIYRLLNDRDPELAHLEYRLAQLAEESVAADEAVAAEDDVSVEEDAGADHTVVEADSPEDHSSDDRSSDDRSSDDQDSSRVVQEPTRDSSGMTAVERFAMLVEQAGVEQADGDPGEADTDEASDTDVASAAVAEVEAADEVDASDDLTASLVATESLQVAPLSGDLFDLEPLPPAPSLDELFESPSLTQAPSLDSLWADDPALESVTAPPPLDLDSLPPDEPAAEAQAVVEDHAAAQAAETENVAADEDEASTKVEAAEPYEEGEHDVTMEITDAETHSATVTLGDLYLSQGHLAEATKMFRFVLHREPDNPAAIDGLARVEAAELAIRATTEAEPDLPDHDEEETGPVAVMAEPVPDSSGSAKSPLTAAALLADPALSGVVPEGLTAKKILVLDQYLKHLRTASSDHVH